MRKRMIDLNFLNINFGKISGAIKDIFIKILTIPFKLFNSLPWYVKGAMFFVVFLICAFVIYYVWKNRDEWLRVDYG